MIIIGGYNDFGGAVVIDIDDERIFEEGSAGIGDIEQNFWIIVSVLVSIGI